MRYVVLLFLGISFHSFSQDTDTYQPDSVYRVNKVQSRFQQDASSGSWEIYLTYDSAGKLESFLLTKDKKDLEKIVYYDGKEEHYVGPEHRLVKKKKEVSGTNPVHTKDYNVDGTLRSEYDCYYEKPNITTRYAGSDFEKGKKTRTWDLQYKNTFDKAGRLERRQLKEGKKTVQMMLYQYDNKGLLEQKTTMSDLHPPIIENFTYQYY